MPTFQSVSSVLDSITFLDHVVSSKGIKVDPVKIRAVQNWPRPTLTTEIRSLLGLTSYYRWFIEGFSSISTLLTKLTQKGSFFRWSNECELSFQKLKTTLTTDPVLVLPTGKANVVADALSWKVESMGSLAYLPVVERPLAMDVKALANYLCYWSVSTPHQFDDPHMLVLKDTVQLSGAKEVMIGDDGVMKRFMGPVLTFRRVCLHQQLPVEYSDGAV
uniref:Uncharacterized protein LOC104229042 n=1 Tax=Nicotiana sylvestris TaxID=4096 RepID=A0A1U7X0C1_NICSY|nr:PREDICTED: uncharacterized protein LOC104229042 [Nicotiana sylvestris]